MVPVTMMAILFFGFNLWALGLAVGAFFADPLLFGWAWPLRLRRLLRQRPWRGRPRLVADVLRAAALAVFYPVSVLPALLQLISWLLLLTSVFEGCAACSFDQCHRLGSAAGLLIDVSLRRRLGHSPFAAGRASRRHAAADGRNDVGRDRASTRRSMREGLFEELRAKAREAIEVVLHRHGRIVKALQPDRC